MHPSPRVTAIRRLICTCLAAAVLTCVPHAVAQQPGAAAAAPVPMIQLPSFATLFNRYGATVVNISSTRTVSAPGAGALPIPENDPLYEFFRRFMPPPGQGQYQQRGLGSGFIISNDGLILTNAHVVAEADEILVKLTDKREFKAKVLGADSYTDVALLKIDAANLPTVSVGDPNTLNPGDWVAAIGAPFGFENSISSGIVSAKGRTLPNESYVPFIQTDVAVNPGNSGGPLFNMRGEVIGINSMIYSRTGGFMGLSFAIPIDVAMEVAQQLRDQGRVTRSRIGVQVQELTRELAASFGLSQPRGALIANIEEAGPAARAGIRPGDIILSIDGRAIESSADLARFVATTRPGTSVTMDVWRRGKQLSVPVVTAELKPPQPQQPARAEQAPKAAARVGLAVANLPDEMRRSLNLDHGVLVRGAQGLAARAGIRPGDLILTVNGARVSDASQLAAIFEQNAGQSVALQVRRGGATVFVPLKLPAS